MSNINKHEPSMMELSAKAEELVSSRLSALRSAFEPFEMYTHYYQEFSRRKSNSPRRSGDMEDDPYDLYQASYSQDRGESSSLRSKSLSDPSIQECARYKFTRFAHT